MSKPKEEVFALFRSLRPDDKHLQTSQPVAAHEAQQRWPILKAIAPTCPQATTPLSEEERLVWTSPERQSGSGRKAVLSVPGLSDKLTKGLLKMSGRVLTTAPSMASAKTSVVIAPPKPVQAITPVAVAPAVPVVPVSSGVPKSKLVPANSRVPEPQSNEPSVGLLAAAKGGIFAKAPVVAPVVVPAIAVEKAASTSAPLDPSLQAVFGRLARTAPAQASGPVKKASFLSQLGKK